jgi:hypothetical protein
MDPAMAVGLVRAAYEFAVLLLGLGAVAAVIGAVKALRRGVVLPEAEQRRPHRMVAAGAESAAPRAPHDVPMKGKPIRPPQRPVMWKRPPLGPGTRRWQR